MSWLGESKLSLSTYDNSIPNSFTLFALLLIAAKKLNLSPSSGLYGTRQCHIYWMLIDFLLKNTNKRRGECFVKLNHKFNPAEKYGVQQYWFKDCNKGYHGLAAQICSSGHKDSGNWKNANRKLSPSHITLGLPSPLPQACVLNQFIRIYFECLNLEMSPTQIMSCNFFRRLRCKMFGLVKQLNKE